LTVSSTPQASPALLAGLAADATPDESLAPWTSLRVGGPAELLVRPRAPDALVGVLARARADGIPVHVLGGGANTLVGDLGVPGITLKLPADLFAEEVHPLAPGGGRVTLGAGAAIVRLPNVMRARGWVGAEFLAGIPGTIGGAVAMNAGTKNGECERVLEAVELATPDGIGWVPRSALTLRYRFTELPPGAIITRARFRLTDGDVAASRAAMEEDLGYRKRTQPLSQPNCGSVFTNPPGDHAGRLIDSVGLKGARLGNAQISPLHANWIVNLGGARAADVVGLIERAQARVREATGILLVPEVKRVGAFA
jgi:UDP-N-acetylmuramate dehydrogenase